MATRQIPWARVLVEGAVIVASILLALAADAWWDGRQERAEEQQILRGLEVDFEANLRELKNTLQGLEAVGQGLIRLSETQPGEVLAADNESVEEYARAINANDTFDERSGTLDAAISSGELGLISDLGLREMLVEWKSLLADADERADELLAVNERVLSRSAQLGGPWSGTGSGPMHRVPEARRIAESLPVVDLQAVRTDPELMSLLREKRLRVGAYIMRLVPVVEMGDSVLIRARANLR